VLASLDAFHGVLAEDIGPKWVYWPWVSDHYAEIRERLTQHVSLTLWAVGIGILIALPLALLANRYRWLYPPELAVAGILYTIPSLALFVILIPWTGLSRETALIPLVAYTQLILIRNIVTGLDAVPADVKESARGMGYRPLRQLFVVELPLALPAIMAGVRIALVTTIGLVTVTALIGQGGLGQFMIDGFQRDFRTPITVGLVLAVALSVVGDVLLLTIQRLATPWLRRGRVGA
jgi:osmoprotectant transport system permease protein